jgi:hypothetical protein
LLAVLPLLLVVPPLVPLLLPVVVPPVVPLLDVPLDVPVEVPPDEPLEVPVVLSPLLLVPPVVEAVPELLLVSPPPLLLLEDVPFLLPAPPVEEPEHAAPAKAAATHVVRTITLLAVGVRIEKLRRVVRARLAGALHMGSGCGRPGRLRPLRAEREGRRAVSGENEGDSRETYVASGASERDFPRDVRLISREAARIPQESRGIRPKTLTSPGALGDLATWRSSPSRGVIEPSAMRAE